MNIACIEAQTAVVFSTGLGDVPKEQQCVCVCVRRVSILLPPSPDRSRLATDSHTFLGSCGLVTVIYVYLDFWPDVNRGSSYMKPVFVLLPHHVR